MNNLKADYERKHKVTLSKLIIENLHEEEKAKQSGGTRPRSQVSFKSGAPQGDISKHLANKLDTIELSQFKSHTHKQAEHLAHLPLRPLDIVISPGP